MFDFFVGGVALSDAPAKTADENRGREPAIQGLAHVSETAPGCPHRSADARIVNTSDQTV